MTIRQSRRRFLATLSLAGAASILRTPSSWANEQAPKTPTVRLPKQSLGAICVAPERILNDLLGAEGFNDIRYIAVASIEQLEFRGPAHWPTTTACAGCLLRRPKTMLPGSGVEIALSSLGNLFLRFFLRLRLAFSSSKKANRCRRQ